MFKNFDTSDFLIILSGIIGILFVLYLIADSVVNVSHESDVFYECVTKGRVEVKGSMFTCELVKADKDE